MKSIKLLITMLLISSFAFSADILTLTNQKTFQGKVTRIKDCSIIFKTGNDQYEIPAQEIYMISFGDTTDKVYIRYMETLDDNPDKCLQGKLDAENYHGKAGGHFVLGCLFGPFAMIGTALSNPTPDRGKLTQYKSNNKDLFDDPEYLSCYKKKAKGQLITAELLGWGAYIIFYMLLSATAN